MSFYQGNRPGIPNQSQSIMSEVNTLQDLSTSSPGMLPDEVSLDHVFSAMMQELQDLFDQVSACETEFQQITKRRSRRSQSEDSRNNDEYMELLAKKGNLLEGITSALEKIELSPDIPKAKVHCYQKYATLLKDRHDQISHDVSALIADLKATTTECERVEKQIETFKKLKENEDVTNEGEKVNQLFNEAKKDLNTILSVLYPENMKREFALTMAQLTDAFMQNDNEEDQFIELSPETLQNPAMITMMKGHVIVKDPSNPMKYRLNMAE
ncbi:uncharacterized protein LOC128992601 [Macrosteles quadrilineatus]|uniref:uncharacterized protein LOC128992601 n=1 Tax=Macrosteles quadrilineatus TaxID=74068 RepID=UPI0023E1047C|nr:uncharacterized protein LOC128992601 [Macrosteles quadrilineatus]